MKSKALLAGILLAALSFGAQDTIRLVRHYKEGDVDAYNLHSTATTSMGDADVNFKMSQTVKKVYDTGEADIDTAITDFKIIFNGNEIPAPAMPSSLVHVDKHGLPTKMDKDNMMSRMQFMRYSSVLFDRDLKVGEIVPIDMVDPENPKSKTTGTVKVESVTNGEAKIISNLSVLTPESSEPMKIDLTTFVDVASSKPNRLEGSVANMAMDTHGGPPVTALHFTMDRVKS